jgi:hypothetical protein
MNDCRSGNGVQKPAYSPASSNLVYFPRPLVAPPPPACEAIPLPMLPVEAEPLPALLEAGAAALAELPPLLPEDGRGAKVWEPLPL